MYKQISILLSIFIIAFALVGSFIKTNEVAPPNARMIVDHYSNVYVSPPCFDEADVSNILEEVTYLEALEMDYQPDSSCTENSLVGEPRSLISQMMQAIGLQTGKWDRDGDWQG